MVDIDAIYEESLIPGPHALVDASTVARYAEAPFGVYCDTSAPAEERDPLDPYQGLLFQRGREHESKVVKESYPDARREAFVSEEEGFRKTLAMMADGVAAIWGMPLLYLPEGLGGRPDMLVRDDGGVSRFGPYRYFVVEIKSAKNIRDFHRVQGAFYTRLLGLVQGVVPETFSVVNVAGDLLSFSRREHDRAVDQAVAGVRRIYAGESVAPCYGSCPWPWQSYGERLARESRDVSLIAGVGPALQASLKAAGLSTVDDVATATPARLQQVKGIGRKHANNFFTKARAIVAGAPLPREGGRPALPNRRVELFLDLEGTDPRFDADGLPVTNYLIGVVSRQGASVTYRPFFAHRPEEEGRILAQFCDYVGSLDDYVIYHWHHYERVHLQKMLHYYRLSSGVGAQVLDRLVDLHPIVTRAFAFPTYSDGLKEIARYLGFEWRQGDVDALTSVALYLEYVASGGADRDAVSSIITYNEDDCRATMLIKDWLTMQQS